ncbi:MAG: LLM class flavin-dependent oxidoreductase [Alphaproteobacteria bacterium]|jgi:limonene 1,2-monooxygenase|nr:LLM class flavin-dependent oxidoreductase [Alphaproteobacteria bacterium]|tara:strand:+ start:25289 stop:26452 length:1164 start_codon:yes stop_codon:yes gene_type:complete
MFRENVKMGVFLPPHHPNDEDPTLALQRDFELIEFLERLGYHEAWIGEHHSGGFEIISSPEVFIAAAAERTKKIMLGSGVVSLPYHNPLMVAERFLQLDHQTRGRAILGVGPGQLQSDARMLCIEASKQRQMMAESLDIILRLFSGEVVTHQSDWINLNQAQTNLKPYTWPRPPVAIASAVTPTGAKLAGRYGLGLLCLAASVFAAYDVLDVNWRVACEEAKEHGTEMHPENLRLVVPMHLAETRERAWSNIQFGFEPWESYSFSVNPKTGLLGLGGIEEAVNNGLAVVGTPNDAIECLEKYWDKTGGFGCFLQLATNWAEFENTKKSYELFARYVMPKFASRNSQREQSLLHMHRNREDYSESYRSASQAAIDEHFSEHVKGEKKE